MPPAIARMESHALLSKSARASLHSDAMTAVKTPAAPFGFTDNCDASEGVFVTQAEHATRRLRQIARQRRTLPRRDPGEHQADAPPLAKRQGAAHQRSGTLVSPRPMRKAHPCARIGLYPFAHFSGGLDVRRRAGMKASQQRSAGRLHD